MKLYTQYYGNKISTVCVVLKFKPQGKLKPETKFKKI